MNIRHVKSSNTNTYLEYCYHQTFIRWL